MLCSIVDDETGEVKGKLYPGDRILRSKSLTAYQKQQKVTKLRPGTEDFKLEQFFKGHTEEIKKILEELSLNERAFLFSIAPYIGYEDCCLKYRNGKDLNTESLVKITGMQTNLLYRTLSTLISKDIIYKGKNSTSRQYFVNPWIFCKGQRINKVLKKMFENYHIRVLNGMQWKKVK